MNERLLDIACCPVTHQPLRKADKALIDRLASLFEAGQLTNLAGERPAQPPSAALVSRDGQRVYPVADGLVALIADESFLLESER